MPHCPYHSASRACHSCVDRWGGWNLCAAVQEASTIMYGFRKHRSQATAQPSVGMTCSLKPALTLVKPSLLCHSSPAAHVIPAAVCAGAWNLWEAVQKTRTIMYDFRKHRSQATAQPSVGMTCSLKPAFTLMDASLPCHSYEGRWVSMESMGGGSKGKNL